MLRKCVVLAVFLLIVPTVGAQGTEEKQRSFSSVKEGTGLGNPPSAPMKKHGGRSGLKTSDGEPHSGKSAGVVIVSANTDEKGESLCIVMDEPLTNNGYDFLEATIQSLIFRPSPKRSSLLEIIWSGQINVYSTENPTWGPADQQAFLKCSVSQRGETVPCSGTAWIPSVVQDMTGDGITEWVTYHGYVEFNPKHEVTVEIWMWTGPSTETWVCGDTLTLKY